MSKAPSQFTAATLPIDLDAIVGVSVPTGGTPTHAQRRGTLRQIGESVLRDVRAKIRVADYDGEGVIPTLSTTNSALEITSNFGGYHGIEFWNTRIPTDIGTDWGGFSFLQRISGGTGYINVFYCLADPVYTEYGVGIDSDASYFIFGQDGLMGSEGGSAFNGTRTNTPFFLYTNNSYLLENPPICSISPLQKNQRIVAKTSDYSITDLIVASPLPDFGVTFTNTGAAGTVIITLDGDVSVGWEDTFAVDAGQLLRIQLPAGHTLQIGGAISAAAGKAESDIPGSSVTLVAITTTKFAATSVVGSWRVT